MQEKGCGVSGNYGNKMKAFHGAKRLVDLLLGKSMTSYGSCYQNGLRETVDIPGYEDEDKPGEFSGPSNVVKFSMPFETHPERPEDAIHEIYAEAARKIIRDYASEALQDWGLDLGIQILGHKIQGPEYTVLGSVSVEYTDILQMMEDDGILQVDI